MRQSRRRARRPSGRLLRRVRQPECGRAGRGGCAVGARRRERPGRLRRPARHRATVRRMGARDGPPAVIRGNAAGSRRRQRAVSEEQRRGARPRAQAGGLYEGRAVRRPHHGRANPARLPHGRQHP